MVPITSPWTAELSTDRLVLTPLRSVDASEMVGVLADSELYTFTGGHPPSLEQLESRYRAQVGGPLTGDEVWHNWILRLGEPQIAVGFVQATVAADSADVAWLVGIQWQGRGIATEAATAMYGWLVSHGVKRLTAHIHAGHEPSGRVASALGLRPTDEVDTSGEVVWVSHGERRYLDDGSLGKSVSRRFV